MQNQAHNYTTSYTYTHTHTHITPTFNALQVQSNGAYCSGLSLQGARWSTSGGHLTDSPDRELVHVLPLVRLEAIPMNQAKALQAGCYECPVYYTNLRGSTYVFSVYLQHMDKPPANSMLWASPTDAWAFRGVAVLLNNEM